MLKRIFSIFTMALLLQSIAFAAEPISKHKKTDVTIGGHDTVAYHDDKNVAKNKATKGEKDLTVEWMGAVWQFTNEQNRDAFLADPDRYRPAYGGHCANALSLGEGLIKTDGKTWEIFEDQLYVFYAPRGRKRWNNGNWAGYKADADNAWQEILDNG